MKEGNDVLLLKNTFINRRKLQQVFYMELIVAQLTNGNFMGIKRIVVMRKLLLYEVSFVEQIRTKRQKHRHNKNIVANKKMILVVPSVGKLSNSRSQRPGVNRMPATAFQVSLELLCVLQHNCQDPRLAKSANQRDTNETY